MVLSILVVRRANDLKICLNLSLQFEATEGEEEEALMLKHAEEDVSKRGVSKRRC